MYSVIIPTFNRLPWLLEAVHSVLQQHVEHVEIIVVDDGSSDGTREALQEFSGKLRYYYQTNQGPAAARNLGLEKATGRYVSFLDSDDLWLPGKIAHELELFRQYPEVEAVVGNAAAYREGQLRFASSFQARNIPFENGRPTCFSWSFANMTLGPLCATSSMCIKRESLPKLGQTVFDASLRFDEDWDLEFRLFSRCKVLFFPEVLTRVRTFDDGTRQYYSVSGKEKSLEEKRRIWTTQIDILERYLEQIDWGQAAATRFAARRDELLGQVSELVSE